MSTSDSIRFHTGSALIRDKHTASARLIPTVSFTLGTLARDCCLDAEEPKDRKIPMARSHQTALMAGMAVGAHPLPQLLQPVASQDC